MKLRETKRHKIASHIKKRVGVEIRMIGGVPHVQVVCTGCKLPVWTDARTAPKHECYRCDTCDGDPRKAYTTLHDCGGGDRVIRKRAEAS